MIRQNKTSSTAVVLIAALLLALWPLPGTMALRNILLLTGFLFAIPTLKNHFHVLLTRDAWPVYVLFAFFLWLCVHFAFFAGDRVEQRQELFGEWPRSLLAAVLGLALGVVLTSRYNGSNTMRGQHLQTLLILGFAGTVIIFCGRYAYEIFRTDRWLHEDFFMTPYLGKTPLVIFGSIFLPVVFIKVLDALKGQENWRWFIYGILGIVLTLSMFYFGNTKNGFAIFAVLFGCFLFCAFQQTTRSSAPLRRGIGIAVLLVCVLTFGFAGKKHLEANSAWSNLIADFKISVQIDRHTNWKDRVSPYPLNEYGTTVNGSTYERVAWARAGIELLREHPYGYGLINHSFGALAIKKWDGFRQPDGKNRGSTHGGWLDFALGFGIVGLLLVWVPLIVALWRTRARHDFWARYTTWAIPVIGLTYLTTEVCTGHFIELLFFMTAMFCGLTLKKPDAASPSADGST